MVEATTVKLITCFCLHPRLLIVDDKKHKHAHNNEASIPQLVCLYCNYFVHRISCLLASSVYPELPLPPMSSP